MTIAIAGHRGYIGGALYDALPYHPYVDHFRIDDEREAAELVRHSDTLYICAGVTGGAGLLKKDPRALVGPNVRLHQLLFDACVETGCRKVICMGSTTGYPEADAPLREDDYQRGEVPACYFNPGTARRFIESMAAMYPELDVTFLRATNVYGTTRDNYDPESSHVIAATIRKVAERQDPLTVWGDGHDRRDAIHIEDMVRALILAKDAPPGAYNIGFGSTMSVREMLGVLLMEAGYEPEVIFDAAKPSLLRSREVDITKARDVLKWEPTISMVDGLRRTLREYVAAR